MALHHIKQHFKQHDNYKSKLRNWAKLTPITVSREKEVKLHTYKDKQNAIVIQVKSTTKLSLA